MDKDRAIQLAQEVLDNRLGLNGMQGHQRYSRTGGRLCEANKKFADMVLAEHENSRRSQFDRLHRQLSGGSGVAADVDVSPVWERTVIRESLYNLAALSFVDAASLPFGPVASIPYSFRDTTAAGRSNARVYQGGGIQRAGVQQAAETVYPLPQKLSFAVSDEVAHITASSDLNWDVLAENQRNASRIIAEDTDKQLLDEHVNAADEFGAVAVSNEDLQPQADGTKTILLTAQFPVVRPRRVYDLSGVQVGSTSNPITVTYNGIARGEYDGTGTQPAGTYYVMDYNLGEIHLVDETGAVQAPGAAVTYTISYSYATNVYNFDADVPSGVDADVHFDSLLYRIGLRKSVLEDDRSHRADMMAMRGAVMSQIERARSFGGNFSQPGTDLTADGTLGRVKGVPAFKAWGGNLAMADNRLIIGERGTVRFRMMKPWELGALVPVRDANGRFTGQKEAYGDQFIVVHTPTQLKRALTTINLFSATARVAR